MNTSRRTAVIVGILYIIGTISAIISGSFTQPILSGPNYLSEIAAHEGQVTIGILFWLAMPFALSMIPVMLYPILKINHPVLALGYVVFRGALETVVGLIMAISLLLLVLLSQQYAGTSDASLFHVLGAFVLKSYHSINLVLIMTFSLGALMLYAMLYQTRLVPRWMSVWGFVAILLHFSTAFLILFHIVPADDMSVLLVINFPIFLQEMVMAVWLIMRGFRSPRVIPASATPGIHQPQMSMGR
jgi:hypothetical protein